MQSIDVAPDGATFPTSGDGQVSLWDVRTGARFASVALATVEVRVTFLDDGYTLLIAGPDGALHTWDTRLEHWIEFACTVAGCPY